MESLSTRIRAGIRTRSIWGVFTAVGVTLAAWFVLWPLGLTALAYLALPAAYAAAPKIGQQMEKAGRAFRRQFPEVSRFARRHSLAMTWGSLGLMCLGSWGGMLPLYFVGLAGLCAPMTASSSVKTYKRSLERRTPATPEAPRTSREETPAPERSAGLVGRSVSRQGATPRIELKGRPSRDGVGR